MPLYTSTTNTRGLQPDDFGPLVVQPTIDQAVAAKVSRVVTTSASSFRIPVVTADASAAWVAEGDEITPSDPTLAESLSRRRRSAD